MAPPPAWTPVTLSRIWAWIFLVAAVLAGFSPFSAVVQAQIPSTSNCQVTTPDGYQFNLCGLRYNTGAGYVHRLHGAGMETITYSMNVCAEPLFVDSSACAQVKSGAAMIQQTTNSCYKLGSLASQSATLVDPSNPDRGVDLTYRDGTDDRILIIRYLCSEQEGALAVDNPPRSITYTAILSSAQACPLNTVSSGTVFLLWLSFIAFLYVGAGILFNVAVHGLAGMEALPNQEFWQSLPGLVWDGIVFSKMQLTDLLDNRRAGYQEI